MSKTREVEESPVNQGEDEEISYEFKWDKVSGTLSNPVVELYDITGDGYEDVSDESLKGAGLPVIEGKHVVTPFVYKLEDKREYRLECKVTINENVLEEYCIIKCEK